MAPTDMIYIPFPKKLYDDIVRFSDGQIDVSSLAEDQIWSWLNASVSFETWDWGDRWFEVAEVYAPSEAEKYKANMKAAKDALRSARFAERRPLIWKEVSVPSGTLVRMHYQGTDHFAEVKNGKIVDEEGEFSPSEWASKVANRTSRNAWRDIWFKEPNAKGWSAAGDMREAARKALKGDTDPAE